MALRQEDHNLTLSKFEAHIFCKSNFTTFALRGEKRNNENKAIQLSSCNMITATFVVKELNVWGKRSNVNVVMWNFKGYLIFKPRLFKETRMKNLS